MSLDKVNGKDNTKKDIDWTDLISYSEEEILAHQTKIKAIRKSLIFFKKQAESGIPFRPEKQSRHK
jgi:hypothetical protein